MPFTPRSQPTTPLRVTKSKSGRQSPMIASLKENGVEVNRDPEQSHWPGHVSELASHLLKSFSDLIPISKLDLEWGKIPNDAVDCDEPSQRAKEEMVESASMIQEKCEHIIEHQRTGDELEWNNLWSDIFRDHVEVAHVDHGPKTLHHTLSQTKDKQFSKTEGLYDVEECQLTLPKPDITLAFPTFCENMTDEESKCFSHKILYGLQAYKLISSPFADSHKVCFPWGIYEGKSKSGKRLDPECQAASAAVKCLKILGRLMEGPDPSQKGDVKERVTLPIPCITCRGQNWELWICYRSNGGSSRPTYDLDLVFKGDMSKLWSNLQLVYIIERLKDWALDTFKPWVHKYLKHWIKFSESNPPPKLPGLSLPQSRDSRSRRRSSSHGVGNGFNYSDIEPDNDESIFFDYSKDQSDELHPWLRTPTTAGRSRRSSGVGRDYGEDSEREGDLGYKPAEGGNSSPSNGHPEDTPEIEKLFEVSKKRASYNKYLSVPEVEYHIKWKDGWFRGEYIEGSPQRYEIDTIKGTKEIEKHGKKVELSLFQFRKKWIRKGLLNEDEINVIHAMEATLGT